MPRSTNVVDIGKPSLREQVQAEKARRSLSQFIRQAWHLVDPAEYVHGWIIDAIAEHLMAVTAGQIRDLLITVPPRHAKSTSVAVMWFCWSWIDHPQTRWLYASYSLSLSERDSRKCRTILESPWYQRNFGGSFKLTHATQKRLENSKGGHRISVSTTSSATGEGGDIVVCDDPHNALEAESAHMREVVRNWWDLTMSTRLNSQKKGSRVLVMQRLHQQDLAGHVLEQGGWEQVDLPAEYEPSRKIVTCIGWSDPRTHEGQLLWPERVGPQEIDKAKRVLGPIGYAGQYQQRPMPASGAQFRAEWIRRYRIDARYVYLDTPDGEKIYAIADCRCIATLDLAISKKETADYTVVASWLITPGNELVLREIIRKRMSNPEQQTAIKNAHSKWHYDTIHIESVAYQLTLVQQLLPLGIPATPFHVEGDKVARASTASVFYAGSMIYHPVWAQWLEAFEEELLMFPKAEHDDQVDVVSMAARLLFDGGTIPTYATSSISTPENPLPTRYTSENKEEDKKLQQQQDRIASILSALRELGAK
jgi:predicted phage terminase large subunit-like protein